MFDINSSVLGKCGFSASQLESVIDSTGLSGLGQSFYDAEQKYNINALYLIAHAAIESAWGTSWFAVNRNNLYGYEAYDSNVMQAKTFSSKAECIDFIGSFLLVNYLTLGGAYYEGSTLHDIFIHYSSSHDAEAQNVASIMNDLINKLPNLMENQNNTHVQILSLDISGQWDTIVDAMEANEFDDKTWNAIKNLISRKKGEFQRVIDGVVKEDIKFDDSQPSITPTDTQIIDQLNQKINDLQTTNDTLTKENQTLSASVQSLSTEFDKDEQKIKQLQAQITLLQQNMPITPTTTPITVDPATVNTIVATGLNINPVLKRWLKVHIATYFPTVITIIITILSGHSDMTLAFAGFSFTIGNIIAVLLAIEKSFAQNI